MHTRVRSPPIIILRLNLQAWHFSKNRPPPRLEFCKIVLQSCPLALSKIVFCTGAQHRLSKVTEAESRATASLRRQRRQRINRYSDLERHQACGGCRCSRRRTDTFFSEIMFKFGETNSRSYVPDCWISEYLLHLSNPMILPSSNTLIWLGDIFETVADDELMVEKQHKLALKLFQIQLKEQIYLTKKVN